jgi:hypothetical protein
MLKVKPSHSEDQTQAKDQQEKKTYQAPRVTETFQLEALAVLCTDTNAKMEVALGCNPGALFS